MSLSKTLVGALLVAVAGGCSHEQKPQPRTPPVAAAPRPPRRGSAPAGGKDLAAVGARRMIR